MKEKTKENIHKLGWVAAAAIVVCTFWWLWNRSQEEPVEYFTKYFCVFTHFYNII